MPVFKDGNGTVWYVNQFDVMDLPDLFAAEVDGWLETDMEPLEKSGTVDGIWYPLQAEDIEQLEARKETLENGIGKMPSVRTHGRKSLHI